MKLTSVAKALSIAATRLGMAASVQPKSMDMGVVVSPIKLAYELGTFILRMAKMESVAALDSAGAVSQVFLHFFKTKTDSAALADAVAFDFYKALTDQAGFTDVQIFDFFKALADTARVSDVQTMRLDKPLAEQFSALDSAVAAFGKALTDTTAVSDDDVIDFFKTLADSYSVTDTQVIALGKALDDSAGFTDGLYRDISKALFDQIMVTDDLDGAASIDDDQTMVFSKQVTDLFGAVDLFTRVVGFVRSFEDSAAASDTAVFVAGKGLDEVPVLHDTDIRFAGTKALTDDGVVVESIAKAFSPAPHTDSFATLDQYSLTPGVVKTDTASITDTGSLRSQGYCDFSYFAEDYVGASRTF